MAVHPDIGLPRAVVDMVQGLRTESYIGKDDWDAVGQAIAFVDPLPQWAQDMKNAAGDKPGKKYIHDLARVALGRLIEAQYDAGL
jgi:hypothetical protein